MELPVNYETTPWQQRKAVRNEYVKLQHGLCYYCGTLLTEQPHDSVKQKVVTKQLFPLNFFKYPVHLHHSHITGMTIGAVHCYCNAVLWQYHNE